MSPGALGRGCARRGSGESHTLASSLLPRAAPGRGLAVKTPGLGDGLGQGLGAGPPEKRPESFCEVPEATEPLCPETRPRPGITALGAAGLARFPVLGAREGHRESSRAPRLLSEVGKNSGGQSLVLILPAPRSSQRHVTRLYQKNP